MNRRHEEAQPSDLFDLGGAVMRTWIADRLDALSAWIRGGDSERWGAIVSDGSMLIRKGTPVHLTLNNASVDLDENAIYDELKRRDLTVKAGVS